MKEKYALIRIQDGMDGSPLHIGLYDRAMVAYRIMAADVCSMVGASETMGFRSDLSIVLGGDLSLELTVAGPCDGQPITRYVWEIVREEHDADNE